MKINDDDLFVNMEDSYKNDSSIELRYSREKRLENAPENVKLLHSPNYIKKTSIFSCILNNKGHKFIFFAIVILVILNFSLYLYYYSSNRGVIEGIKIELDSFQYNGDILVNAILFENKKQMDKTKDVKVFLKAFDKNGQEIFLLEREGVYLGSHLMLHFKIENKEVKKLEALFVINNKMITLSKRI